MGSLDIASAAQLVANLAAAVRGASDLVKASSNHELKVAMNEVYDAVLAVRQRVLDLDEENRELKRQLAEKAGQGERDEDELLHLKVRMRGVNELVDAVDVVEALHHYFFTRKSYVRIPTNAEFLVKYPSNFRAEVCFGGDRFTDHEATLAELKKDTEALRTEDQAAG